jgi:hypothetical protein
MQKTVFKKMFWCNYDHLFPNVLLSLVWTGLNLPVFVFLYFLVGTHVFSPWPYVVVWNFLWLSPLSAGLFHATLPMVNSERSDPPVKAFFAGIRRHALKSLALFSIATAFLLVVVRVFLFYARDAQGLPMFVRFVVAGIALWVGIYFLLMHANFYPVLVLQNEKIGKILYKAFLLVLDRPGNQVLFMVFVGGMFVIMTFSIFGLFLFYPAFYALSVNIQAMVQLARHNKNVVVEEETRTFRHLLRPWE